MSLASRQFRRKFTLLPLTLMLGLVMFAAPVVAQTCTSPVPATWTNRVETINGSLRITLATLQYDYLPGEPVAMKLHIENIGASSVFVANPGMITPLDVFGIVSDNCDSLSQPGCVEVYHQPQVILFFGTGYTLQPGQCREYNRTWDGLTGGPPAPPPDGIYAIISGLSGFPSATDGIYLPPGGLRLTIRIDGAVPVQSSTWSAIKTRND